MSYWEHTKPVHRARAVDVRGIAMAAVELLDAGGMRALTVRAVAQRLGVAPASLYSRIESVDDLFDLALDHALGADPTLGGFVAGDDLRALMLEFYRHLTRHPWACHVIGMRAPRGPHYLRLSELMVGSLESSRVADPLETAYTLSNFVIGSAATAHIVADTIAAGLIWAIDKPLTPSLAQDIVALCNAKFRTMKQAGEILGAEAWFDPTRNPVGDLKAGKLSIRYKYTPVPPLEHLHLSQEVTDDLLSNFATLAAAA